VVSASREIAASPERTGGVRHNHVVEFEEGRRIAWPPSPKPLPKPLHPNDFGRSSYTS